MHAMATRRKKIRAEDAEKSARDFQRWRIRKVAIFVEPYARYAREWNEESILRLIENLVELGDEVVVITPCVDPPKSTAGLKLSA